MEAKPDCREEERWKNTRRRERSDVSPEAVVPPQLKLVPVRAAGVPCSHRAAVHVV